MSSPAHRITYKGVKERFQSNVDRLCRERGWNVWRLVQESGVHRSTVYRIVNGDEKSVPNVVVVMKIAAALGVRMDTLFH